MSDNITFASTETNRIVFHFNKKHLEDSSIPMWTIKHKGVTYYVNHLDSKVGFSTKETPDSEHTVNFFDVFILKTTNMSKKLTTREFVEKAKKIHGDKYDYSNVDYENNHTKVKITCKEHGVFEQRPNCHTSKKTGCPICAGKDKNIYTFIRESRLTHGDKYDYSKSVYTGIDSQVLIICRRHGEFKQTAYTHKTGSGCPRCRNEHLSIKTRDSLSTFIEKAIKVHGKTYDYSLVDYKNQMTKISIICRKHGEFKQIPNSHLHGRGCPVCKESTGERKVREFLNANNIKFIQQYKFEQCVNVSSNRKLSFDFYLIDYNLCIEYDGKQHFTYINSGFGARLENAINNYNKLVTNDEIKNNFCKKNNINLLRIKYTDNIYEKISQKIKELGGL